MAEEKKIEDLTTFIEEGFEKVGKDIDKKLETKASKDDLKSIQEEIKVGLEKSEKRSSELFNVDTRKKLDIFKKDGKFMGQGRWLDVNDFFKAATAASMPETGAALRKNTTLNVEQFRNWQKEQKALVEGTDNVGGYLVPQEMSSALVELLDSPDMITSYVNRITTSRDNLYVNSESTEPNGAFIAEVTAIEGSTTQPVLAQDAIVVYAYKAGFKVSNDLIADAISNVGQYLTRKMVSQFAYAKQKYVISGTGSSQPYGVTAATPNTTTNFATLAWSNLLAAYYGIKNVYRRTAVWGTRAAIMPTILNLQDTGSHLVFSGNSVANPPDKILGRQIVEDDNWNANDVEFVDMDGYVLAERGLIEFFVTPHPYANENETYFRFMERWGGQLVRTAGYYRLNKT